MTERKKVVWAYHGFQTFFALYLWMPIFYTFQRQAGLEDGEIFAIQSTYYLWFCLLEIPTGWLADRFGYLRTLRGAALVQVASHLFAIFLPTYGGFLTHWMLLGLARSLVSGAASAYLYEYLKQRGEQDAYREIEGNARAIGLGAKVVGWAGVGLLMAWQPTSPYWLTAGFSLIAFWCVLSLPNLGAASGPSRNNDLALAAVRVTFTQPALLLIMLLGATVFVTGRIVQVNAYQPLLEHHHFPLAHHGLIMSAMTIVEAIGSSRTRWLDRWFSPAGAMVVATIGVCASLALFGFGPWTAIAGLMLFAWTTGLGYPLQKQLLNDAIPDSRLRATLMSVESIIDRAISAPMAVLLGAYVATGTLPDFMLYTAAIGGGLTLAAYVALRFWVGFRPGVPVAVRAPS